MAFIAPVLGLVCPSEALIAQSYSAKQYNECGVVLNRVRFIIAVLTIPVAILFWHAEGILITVTGDPDTSRIAANYAWLMLPGAWALSMIEAMLCFLNGQLNFKFSTKLQICATFLNALISICFIVLLDQREIGAALA